MATSITPPVLTTPQLNVCIKDAIESAGLSSFAAANHPNVVQHIAEAVVEVRDQLAQQKIHGDACKELDKYIRQIEKLLKQRQWLSIEAKAIVCDALDAPFGKLLPLPETLNEDLGRVKQAIKKAPKKNKLRSQFAARIAIIMEHDMGLPAPLTRDTFLSPSPSSLASGAFGKLLRELFPLIGDTLPDDSYPIMKAALKEILKTDS